MSSVENTSTAVDQFNMFRHIHLLSYAIVLSDPLGFILVPLPLAESIIYLDHFRSVEYMAAGLDNVPILNMSLFIAL